MPNGWGGGLAAGLAQGFTGYLQGQQAAEQRKYERQQEADRIARENEQRAFQQMLQQHAMKLQDAAETRAKQDQAIQMGKEGYAEMNPAAVDQSFQQAGNALGSTGGMLGLLAAHATKQTTQPGMPVKVRKSDAQMAAEEARRAQYADRAEARTIQLQDRADERKWMADRDAAQNAARMRELQARLSADAAQPPSLKTLPQGVETAISENNTVLSAIDEANQLLSAGRGTGAFGRGKGIARTFGVERAFTTPEDQELAAVVGNIASQQIKLRSGAAVTASEWPRLRPFIPVLDGPGADDAPTIRRKLAKMAEIISAETDSRAQYYEGQGYAVPKRAPMNPPPSVDNDKKRPGSVLLNFDTGVRR